MSPRASNRASEVLAPIRRKWALSFENAISMGFRSGLYGGRNKNQHPCLFKDWAARGLLWVDRFVKDDDGTRIEHRCELRFDVSVKCRTVHCPGDDPRRDQRILCQSGNKRLRPPFSERCGTIKSLTNRRTSSQAGQVRFDSGLVDEDQPVWFLAQPRLAACDPVPACQSQRGPITFRGDQSFFYMTTRRAPGRGAAMTVAPEPLRYRTAQRPIP